MHHPFKLRMYRANRNYSHTMKLGVLTDIHNNLIALKTVVEYFEQQNCEKIICCGDIIGIAPYPEKTVKYLRKLPNLIAVKGNHDKYLPHGMPKEYPNEEQMDYGEMQHHKWEHGSVSSPLRMGKRSGTGETGI